MIDDPERLRLHAELDRIIDRANSFTELTTDHYPPSVNRLEAEAHLVVKSALDLAAAASGSDAHFQAVGATSGKPSPVWIGVEKGPR